METHTILLIQPTAEVSSRTYTDFEGITTCINYLFSLYERKLALEQTDSSSLTLNYTLNDLYAYLDEFANVSCLVIENSNGCYAPHGKSWIKKMVYLTLSEMVKQNEKNEKSTSTSALTPTVKPSSKHQDII